MTHAPIRVAILNDFPIVVTGLAALFEHYPRVQIEQLAIKATKVGENVDVVLYDVFAADRRHITIPGSLKPKPPHVKVVIFGWGVDLGTIRDGMKHGIDGYICKGLSAAEIVDAIERVHAGERIIAGADSGVSTPVGDWPGREEGLSARESEIIALVTQGLTNDEIGQSLFLSVNTIKVYLRTAYRKMKVSRRPEAVAWGATHGFQAGLGSDRKFKIVYADEQPDVETHGAHEQG